MEDLLAAAHTEDDTRYCTATSSGNIRLVKGRLAKSVLWKDDKIISLLGKSRVIDKKAKVDGDVRPIIDGTEISIYYNNGWRIHTKNCINAVSSIYDEFLRTYRCKRHISVCGIFTDVRMHPYQYDVFMRFIPIFEYNILSGEITASPMIYTDVTCGVIIARFGKPDIFVPTSIMNTIKSCYYSRYCRDPLSTALNMFIYSFITGNTSVHKWPVLREQLQSIKLFFHKLASMLLLDEYLADDGMIPLLRFVRSKIHNDVNLVQSNSNIVYNLCVDFLFFDEYMKYLRENPPE